MQRRWLRLGASVTAVLGMVVSGCALPHLAAVALQLRQSLPTTNVVLYVHKQQVWLQPLEGGPAREVPLPWKLRYTGDEASWATWSPDGQRIAVDDISSRIAILDLRSGRSTIVQATPGVNYRWSPNSRYLAFLRHPSHGSDVTRDLWVWDRVTGRVKRLVRDAEGLPDWSHDSTRIAIPTGPLDTNSLSNLRTRLASVTIDGHVTRYGWGYEAAWSPDDRFLGYIDLRNCGAAHCEVDEGVVPAAGGKAITLAHSILEDYVHLQWAASPWGYGFDRWSLDRSGRLLRRLAELPLREGAWSADGSYTLAISSYIFEDRGPHRFDADLISRQTGRRINLASTRSQANQGPGKAFMPCTGAHTLALQINDHRMRSTGLLLVTWPGGRLHVTRTSVPPGDPVGLARNDSEWVSWTGAGLTVTDLKTHRTRLAVPGRVVDRLEYTHVKVGSAPVMERCAVEESGPWSS